MHELLKERTGIETANCETCAYITDVGDEYTYLICGKIERMGNLKSFPFKKEMECWHPEFWVSKFTEMIKNGTHEEAEKASKAFAKAVDRRPKE